MQLSVVIPVYLSEASVLPLVRSLRQALASLTEDYEILLVDDGSPDGSWELIRQASQQDKRVKGLRLSRNFGQHYAITAGLSRAQGEFIAVMDCDLQDDPADLLKLYAKLGEGFDVVLALREKRNHPFLKNAMASLFHRVFGWLANRKEVRSGAYVGALSIMRRKVLNAFLEVKDYHRHYLMVLKWLGFSVGYVTVSHRKRPFGKSSYTLRKLISHAINGIVSHSDKLLYLSINLGLLLFVLSVVGTVGLIIAYFALGFAQGWTSLMVVIISSTGLIMMSLGILSIYVGKIFEQTRGRPLFIVQEFTNQD